MNILATRFYIVNNGYIQRYAKIAVMERFTSMSLCKVFQKEWIAIIGQPTKLLSDNGTHSYSKEFEILLAKHTVTPKRTACFSLQSSGISERLNAIILNVLKLAGKK